MPPFLYAILAGVLLLLPACALASPVDAPSGQGADVEVPRLAQLGTGSPSAESSPELGGGALDPAMLGFTPDYGEGAAPFFATQVGPTAGSPEPIGEYSRGCLRGAVQIPEEGPGWQTMRPGRNRTWAHPATRDFVGRLAARARELGWPGILVGDASQPRGGPMPTGHSSHQTGLDVDIWFRRPPEGTLSPADRATLLMTSVVRTGTPFLNARWSDVQARLLESAARDGAVARIFVNPAVKADLCRISPRTDRDWLGKIRPWWGHDAHFHVRLGCPAGATACVAQEPPPPGDGCDSTLQWWFTPEGRRAPAAGDDETEPLELADLPPACAELVGQ